MMRTAKKAIKAQPNGVKQGRWRFTDILKKNDYANMNLIFLIVGTAVIFLLITSCSNSDPPQEPPSADMASGSLADKNLRILFQWPGDDFATKQELETRDHIARLISERRIGNVIQSGTGMGWMDIVVEVVEKDSARKKIEKIIEEISPDAKFSLQ